MKKWPNLVKNENLEIFKRRTPVIGNSPSESKISLDSIQDYSYPISRPLFVYFKKEHMDVVPGLRKFMKMFVHKKAIGKRGYLVELGLVPLDKETMDEMVSRTK